MGIREETMQMLDCDKSNKKKVESALKFLFGEFNLVWKLDIIKTSLFKLGNNKDNVRARNSW